MRRMILLVSMVLLAIFAEATQKVTKEMAVEIDFSSDSRAWRQDRKHTTPKHTYVDFVPEEQQESCRSECLSYSVLFTDKTVNTYADDFEKNAQQTDAQSLVSKQVDEDGAITLIYQTVDKNETTILKFIQGDKTIHLISYDAKQGNDHNVKLWKSIIGKAVLVPKQNT